MRLLNVNTLQLSSFDDANIPTYAIASHRWTSDETTFDDFKRGRNTNTAGYRKVVNFCAMVRDWSQDIEWLWIDTCCIDKTSSAELSEAINSMFRWYGNASVCYAYLFDLCPLSAGIDAVYKSFKASEWFRRGWTLQELLAPDEIVFLTQQWERFGSKGAFVSDLVQLELSIADMTGIPVSVLYDFKSSSTCSDDQKWTWVDGRDTYKDEDMAYCLLGIFGVTMSLIYGEGTHATERLREEIRNKKRRARRKERAASMDRHSTLSISTVETDHKINARQKTPGWNENPAYRPRRETSDEWLEAHMPERSTIERLHSTRPLEGGDAHHERRNGKERSVRFEDGYIAESNKLPTEGAWQFPLFVEPPRRPFRDDPGNYLGFSRSLDSLRENPAQLGSGYFRKTLPGPSNRFTADDFNPLAALAMPVQIGNGVDTNSEPYALAEEKAQMIYNNIPGPPQWAKNTLGQMELLESKGSREATSAIGPKHRRRQKRRNVNGDNEDSDLDQDGWTPRFARTYDNSETVESDVESNASYGSQTSHAADAGEER